MSFDTLPMHGRRIASRTADEFYGVCLGVLSDGTINQIEAEFLLRWLESRPDIRDGSADRVVLQIYHSLKGILSDGVMDDGEQLVLLRLLAEYTGVPQPEQRFDEETGSIFLNDPVPEVIFPERSFCFTGTFAFGKRADCAELLGKLKAVHSKNVTLTLDYLVVGHHVTPDWRHSAYGAKIIKAMEYRDGRGTGLAIIGERQWLGEVKRLLAR